jgi:hypothetical protein
LIAAWVREGYSNHQWLCLLCDLPETTEKPELISGYRPDVLARDVPHTITVVGEAKTGYDVDNSHSEGQLQAFLRYLAVQPQPTLVIATPWHARAAAIRTVNRLVERLGFDRIQRVYLTDGVVTKQP